MSIASVLSALAPFASALPQLVGLVADIAQSKAPEETAKRLRALVATVQDAADDGATEETDDAWVIHLNKHYPRTP